MTIHRVLFGAGRRVGAIAAVAAFIIGLSFPALAGLHRARLSVDLAKRLSSGSDGASQVILAGTDSSVKIIAARYGARITKTLRGAAVLEVTGGQLAALSEDPDVDHLSGDARVSRMASSTRGWRWPTWLVP